MISVRPMNIEIYLSDIRRFSPSFFLHSLQNVDTKLKISYVTGNYDQKYHKRLPLILHAMLQEWLKYSNQVSQNSNIQKATTSAQTYLIHVGSMLLFVGLFDLFNPKHKRPHSSTERVGAPFPNPRLQIVRHLVRILPMLNHAPPLLFFDLLLLKRLFVQWLHGNRLLAGIL